MSMSTVLRWIVTVMSLMPVLLGFSTAAVPAEATTQTYYMMVFSNPVAGHEDEYNKWYDEQHIQDVTALPGFASSQRFVLNDPQMFPGVTVKMPRYLALYKIVTDDLVAVMTEVGRRVQTGQTKISPAYDRSTANTYIYRFSRPEQRRTSPPTAPAGGRNVLYYHIVFTVPASGKEAEFDRWYDEEHGPEMLMRPGILTAQRMVLAQPGRGPITPTEAAAVFKVELPEGKPVYEPRPPGTKPPVRSTILDRTLTRGYTYRAIGPVIDGNTLRQEPIGSAR